MRTGIHVGVDVLINRMQDNTRAKFIVFGLCAGALFTAIIGTLSASLDEVIAQRQPQLLALGRHNRGVLAQTLLSSLAQHYLNKPPCDVLVAR